MLFIKTLCDHFTTSQLSVRMSQDFTMSAPLVNGHGNFGSLDNDPPAAMRYTECKLAPLAATALLADIDERVGVP
jgi:DNA gyrase/topoisomerase IV subunit A